MINLNCEIQKGFIMPQRLYEVVLSQLCDGQQTVNRWNYIGGDATPTEPLAIALVDAMGIDPTGTLTAPKANTLFDALYDLQWTNTKWVGISAFNVYIPTDFYSVGFAASFAGSRSGPQPLPSFMAYGFRTNRVNRAIRRATKRFVGVSYGDLDTDVTFNNATISLMEILADKMSEVIESTVGLPVGETSYQPCVVKKERYAVPGVTPTRYAYRYYTDAAVQLTNTAVGINWEIYEDPRSQVSRQVGRGS